MLSCRRRHITCAHKALSQWLRLNSTRTACPEDAAVINAAEKALHRGIASEIVEFEIGFDEAVAKFDRYQSSAAKGFQAHGLLTSSQARIGAAYLPFWIFKAKVTAEYRGVLGFKDARCVHELSMDIACGCHTPTWAEEACMLFFIMSTKTHG